MTSRNQKNINDNSNVFKSDEENFRTVRKTIRKIVWKDRHKIKKSNNNKPDHTDKKKSGILSLKKKNQKNQTWKISALISMKLLPNFGPREITLSDGCKF